MVTLPYFEASSKTKLSKRGCALSPSTSKAIRFIFSIKKLMQIYVIECEIDCNKKPSAIAKGLT
jgi:hypothetical protein